MSALIGAVVGAHLGSVVNACLHRVRRRIAIVTPPSRCPS
jgi:prepilin signal peptidase PulO-like enzyme (type II secretory pathway)